MPRSYPVKVYYLTPERRVRYKGFDMLPTAQKFANKIRGDNLSVQIFVQGELFETRDNRTSTTYDPRYEIPF